jgi:hypothetical protein
MEISSVFKFCYPGWCPTSQGHSAVVGVLTDHELGMREHGLSFCGRFE